MPQMDLSAFLKSPFEVSDGFVVHPKISPDIVQHRKFQTSIAVRCLGENSIVVLPTGLGKTIIALLVWAETTGKTLFLAPTRPLVQQHRDTFEHLMVPGPTCCLVTGSIPYKKREELYHATDIVFATPQCIANDIEKGTFPAGEFRLVIFDEAHRIVGKYSYVPIAETIRCPVLGLTASPGGKKQKIMEVLENLRITSIQARTRDDPDVKPYIKEITTDWVKVKLDPSMEFIRAVLDDYLVEKITSLQKSGVLTHRDAGRVSKTQILDARGVITTRYGRNKGVMMGLIHNQALAVYAFHCIETLETQGVEQLRAYLERFGDEKLTKSKKAFIGDQRVRKALELSIKYPERSHPKLDALKEMITAQLKETPEGRIIIFTQLRDSIPSIMDTAKASGATAERFVGQAKRPDGKGLKQNEQKALLDGLRNKEFNVLVATSVAEEGLDIPDVDLVVFYEPLPSEIRNIQRRGRTGRSSIGKVKILIAENSRDEAYLWAGISREKKMRGFIKWMEAGAPKTKRRKRERKTSESKNLHL